MVCQEYFHVIPSSSLWIFFVNVLWLNKLYQWVEYEQMDIIAIRLTLDVHLSLWRSFLHSIIPKGKENLVTLPKSCINIIYDICSWTWWLHNHSLHVDSILKSVFKWTFRGFTKCWEKNALGKLLITYTFDSRTFLLSILFASLALNSNAYF